MQRHCTCRRKFCEGRQTAYSKWVAGKRRENDGEYSWRLLHARNRFRRATPKIHPEIRRNNAGTKAGVLLRVLPVNLPRAEACATRTRDARRGDTCERMSVCGDSARPSLLRLCWRGHFCVLQSPGIVRKRDDALLADVLETCLRATSLRREKREQICAKMCCTVWRRKQGFRGIDCVRR